jgi:hypothetical protein
MASRPFKEASRASGRSGALRRHAGDVTMIMTARGCWETLPGTTVRLRDATMREFIPARRPNGAWKLLAPTTPDATLTLLAFREARWDNFEGRWTRPDPRDFEEG